MVMHPAAAPFRRASPCSVRFCAVSKRALRPQKGSSGRLMIESWRPGWRFRHGLSGWRSQREERRVKRVRLLAGQREDLNGEPLHLTVNVRGKRGTEVLIELSPSQAGP